MQLYISYSEAAVRRGFKLKRLAEDISNICNMWKQLHEYFHIDGPNTFN